ncbi:4-oxalomesaconate tautomerase [Streptomyces tendae]
MSLARTGVRCVWMRGGTSKGAYFLASDLPSDPAQRDDLLLRIMGTPDPRQIDGLGGATTLTSKVAIVAPSSSGAADIDYLFLQVGVEEPTVSDAQTCGNLLAGVGQFAVETGLVVASGPSADVQIRMVNTGAYAAAYFPLDSGMPRYDGGTAIDGVPGTAAPVELSFEESAARTTAAAWPAGDFRTRLHGIDVTCADYGMPVVLIAAHDLGLTGHETHAELAADDDLMDRVDQIRREAGLLMGLGDVSTSSVPKTVLVAPPRDGGHLAVRSFVPRRPHTAVGVLAAVTAAIALLADGAVGHELTAEWPDSRGMLDIEHPSGHLLLRLTVDTTRAHPRLLRAGVVRTARKLFVGRALPRV